jgi:hypothetical protein
MRASQFIDFINRKKMPKNEEQLTHYTHIDLEDDKDEDGKILKVNNLKKARRKYRIKLKKGN